MNIAGVVRDEHGDPVDGARVYVVDAPAAVPDIAALTDGEGRFALSVGVSGRYAVEANADGWAPVRATVEVSENASAVDLRFSEPRLG